MCWNISAFNLIYLYYGRVLHTDKRPYRCILLYMEISAVKRLFIASEVRQKGKINGTEENARQL